MSDFTQFTIPVSRDRYGTVEMKHCLVSNALLPLMAAIIDAATRPVKLTEQFYFPVRDAVLTEEVFSQVRDRVRYDLEHALREEAKKTGYTLITRVAIEEIPDVTGVAFIATATAVPMLEVGL